MLGRESVKPIRVVMAALLTLSLTLAVSGTVLADDGEGHGARGGSVQIQINTSTQSGPQTSDASDDGHDKDNHNKDNHDQGQGHNNSTGSGKHGPDDTVTDGLYGKHGSDDTVTDDLYGKHGSDDTVTGDLYGKHGSDDTVTGSLYGKQTEEEREAEVEQASLKQAAQLRQEGHHESYLVFVNGHPLNLTPLAHEGHTLVPFRRLAEFLGAQVSWDQATKSVTMTLGSSTVQLNLHDQTVTINGQTQPLQVPAEIDDGTTYVPLRLIAEALGAKVNYDPTTGAITVVTATTTGTTGTGTTGTGTTGTGTTGTGSTSTGTTSTGTTGTGTTGTGSTSTGTTSTGTTGTGTTTTGTTAP